MAIFPGNSNSQVINGGAENDFMFGDGGNDTMNGNGGADIILGDSGNDSLSGNAGNDTLYGGEGNDILNGIGGVDSLLGGTGDDVYIVDFSTETNNVGIDNIFEDANAGIDTVRSSASFTLGANLENLELLAGASSGTGNDLNNQIIGNSGNNFLNGQLGNDTMEGGLGNDAYVVDSTGDVVTENANAGVDEVLSSVSFSLGDNFENLNLGIAPTLPQIDGTGNAVSNNIQGSNGNNFLSGLGGNDTINGIGGNDTIDGGAGSDNLNGGFGGNDSLFGGSGNDLLQGDDGGIGNDTLDGGTGADTMQGGLGNDVYVVDSVGDIIQGELSFGGTDTVRSSVSFTLGANVENLELLGTASINGTGNELNNRITGNSAGNTINGGDGNDTLIGGGGDDLIIGGIGSDRIHGQAGNDVLNGQSGGDFYVFAGGVFSAANFGVDTIEVFTQNSDKFVLSKATFGLQSAVGNGFSVASEFAVVANDVAAEISGARIVYSAATNNLFFNQNGATAGFGTGGQFAAVSTPEALLPTVNDFVIEA
jgi:Ca2+-binding RTX toxin-like protein